MAVITDRFEASARVTAEANGLAGYPFVVTPHPIANNDDALLRDKAELAVRQAVAILLERGSR